MVKKPNTRPGPKQPRQLSLLDAIDEEANAALRRRLYRSHHKGDTGCTTT